MPPGVMEALERAVASRRRAEILYASLSGATRRWRGVDPYLLFHRDGGWYLAGHCHTNAEPRTFRLDRIAEARLTEASFTPPRDFSLESYLASAWSIFRGPELQDVILRFSPALAPLIEHTQHHPGEELCPLDDGEIEYRVALSHLDEIAPLDRGLRRQGPGGGAGSAPGASAGDRGGGGAGEHWRHVLELGREQAVELGVEPECSWLGVSGVIGPVLYNRLGSDGTSRAAR